MVVHTRNLITQKVEAGESDVQDQPRLHIKFKASLGYMRPCPKKDKKKETRRLTGTSPLPYLVQGRSITGVLSASLTLSRSYYEKVLLGPAHCRPRQLWVGKTKDHSLSS